MGSFLDRVFGSKIEVDLTKLELESKLSFEHCVHDKNLISLLLDKGQLLDINDYLKEIYAVNYTEKISIVRELKLLQDYVGLVTKARGKDFFLQFNQKLQHESLMIEPLILFPLIQNAISNGYASMEKYPIKIRISVANSGVLLEVSNRVNHYLANQAEDEAVRLYTQRLTHAYGDDYELFMNSNSNTFKATLFLKLKE